MQAYSMQEKMTPLSIPWEHPGLVHAAVASVLRPSWLLPQLLCQRITAGHPCHASRSTSFVFTHSSASYFLHPLYATVPHLPYKLLPQVLSLALQACSSHESLSSVSSFLHLQQQQLFMTISYHTLTTWNFKVSRHCEVFLLLL